MNRTLCILAWTIITYYTSFNMEFLNLGNLSQVFGLIIGTSLSVIFIATFIATEREVLKLGAFSSYICLYMGAMSDPNLYFTFFYNIDKSILLHQSVTLIFLGTLGAVRCLYLINKSMQLHLKADNVIQVVRTLFEEDSLPAK